MSKLKNGEQAAYHGYLVKVIEIHSCDCCATIKYQNGITQVVDTDDLYSPPPKEVSWDE